MKIKKLLGLSLLMAIFFHIQGVYPQDIHQLFKSYLKKSNEIIALKQVDYSCNQLVVEITPKSVLSLISNFKNDDYESIKEKLANTPWLPTALEKKLGERVVNEIKDQILDRRKFKDFYQIADREFSFVLKGAQKLAEEQGSKFPAEFKLYIYDSSEKNAFSVPGGFIFISSRFIRDIYRERKSNIKSPTPSEEALRFTLAHEISHNLKRHYDFEVQTKILNGINDINQFRSFISSLKKGFPVSVSHDVLNSKFSISSLHDLLKIKDQILELKGKMEGTFNSLLYFFSQGIVKEAQLKKLTAEKYTDFEKEADACAVKIIYVAYNEDSKKLENNVKNFERVLSETDISKRTVKLSHLKLPVNIDFETAAKIAQSFKEIAEFYFQELQFLHPMTKERVEFINNLVSKVEKSDG